MVGMFGIVAVILMFPRALSENRWTWRVAGEFLVLLVLTVLSILCLVTSASKGGTS